MKYCVAVKYCEGCYNMDIKQVDIGVFRTGRESLLNRSNQADQDLFDKLYLFMMTLEWYLGCPVCFQWID